MTKNRMAVYSLKHPVHFNYNYVNKQRPFSNDVIKTYIVHVLVKLCMTTISILYKSENENKNNVYVNIAGITRKTSVTISNPDEQNDTLLHPKQPQPVNDVEYYNYEQHETENIPMNKLDHYIVSRANQEFYADFEVSILLYLGSPKHTRFLTCLPGLHMRV